MSRRSLVYVTVAVAVIAGAAYAQHPIIDALANKVFECGMIP